MVIRAENLSYTYSEGGPFERAALNDVSMTIKDGEFVGIIGHTGSGKSTLVQHFNGLLQPVSGRVIVGDIDLSAKKADLKTVRTKVGLVFQYPEHQLFEETVRRDIAFAPVNMGFSPVEVNERVERAARLVGLSEEILDKSPFEISGGQKRRAAIAGVLAMDPEVLVLDEPTAGLDPHGRKEILAGLLKLHRETGITVILVSHGMEDIADTVQRLYVMNMGRIVMEGTPLEVYARYEELEEIGLTAPPVTKLIKRLYGADICTLSQAKEYILGVIGRA
ncbi:MAG: Energy-coupling factor transporter ATP-binding protein EcfA2 [Firmicutes bacterium ADurb.Bin193]|nr:MAG: Energy-coupling factor transporter ATP-binding protein EcfA2 [Firmicutes bacterium ADurb.Bin193]